MNNEIQAINDKLKLLIEDAKGSSEGYKIYLRARYKLLLEKRKNLEKKLEDESLPTTEQML